MLSFLLLLVHVIVFSALGLFFYKLRPYFSLIPFYLYLGSLEFLVSILNSIYAIDLGIDLVIGAGQVVYTAILWSILLVYLMERDQKVVKFIIYCLVMVQVMYIIIYPLIYVLLENELVINPLSVPAKLFETSWWIFIVGNFLRLVEAFLMIYLIELFQQKVRVIPWQIKSIIVFNLILVIDGILFPLLAFFALPSLTLAKGLSGIVIKLILGALFSFTLVLAILILKPSFSEKETPDISLTKLMTLPKASLAQKYKDTQEEERMSRLLHNIISYDLNNYSIKTLGRVDLILENKEKLTESTVNMLETVRRHQYEVQNLISNTLDFNNIKTKNLLVVKVDIHAIVVEVLERVRKVYHDIEITTKNLDKLKNINVLANKLLETVFLNLFIYAIKFRKEGEDVVQLDFTQTYDKKFICISVIDKGNGIPNQEKKLFFNYSNIEQRKIMFELYLVSEIMKLYGGKITVHNHPEDPKDSTKGTMFNLYFKEVKN